MSDNNIPKNLLDKLLKLKALEESANSVGSLAEAENAAAKFQSLLLKHNLDAGDVERHGIAEKLVMANEHFALNKYQTKHEANWALKLFQAVAHHCMCQVLTFGMSNRRLYDPHVEIIGEKTNVAMVFYMVEQLVNKIKIAEKLSYKRYFGEDKRNTFKRGFLIGAVEAIYRRLKQNEQEEIRKQQESATFSSNNSMAVVLADKRKQANDHMMELYGDRIKERRTNSRTVSSQDGMVRGYAAGTKMELHKGVESNQANNKLDY